MLDRILAEIRKKNALHAKQVERVLARWEEGVRADLARRLEEYLTFLGSRGIDLATAVDAYLLVVQDTLTEQIHFLKTGRYRHSSFRETCAAVYANPGYMSRYMIGLGVTQFLWENHVRIFRFFGEHLPGGVPADYLEIGPGHGLFFLEALRSGRFRSVTAVDISDTSLAFTRDLVAACAGERRETAAFTRLDLHELAEDRTFAFVAFGEVLEHVEDPRATARKVHALLERDGRAFVSTCANSPAIDHIHLFRSVEEIRALLRECGFAIVEDLALASGNLDLAEAVKRKAAVNYCALLARS